MVLWMFQTFQTVLVRPRELSGTSLARWFMHLVCPRQERAKYNFHKRTRHLFARLVCADISQVLTNYFPLCVAGNILETIENFSMVIYVFRSLLE